MRRLYLVLSVALLSVLSCLGADRPPLPQRLNVCGVVYTVTSVPKVTDCGQGNYIGCTDEVALTIHIKNGMPLSKEQQVFTHEMLHAVVNCSINDGEVLLNEEHWTQLTAVSLANLLKENPEVTRYLQAK